MYFSNHLTFYPSTNYFGLDEIVVRDLHKQNVDKLALREKQAMLPGADLPGFMPLREDFDIEYENDAESLLADMEFSPEDHPGDRDLKLQVIKIYNSKLAERDARKRFVIDRGLIDFKKQQQLEKRRSKEEKEIVSRLKVFSRFHSQADHEALVEGVIKAKKLRKQIELFQHYRQMGIRTLEQARQYEIERKKREHEQKSAKARESTPYLFETGRGEGNKNCDGNSSSSSSRGGRGKGANGNGYSVDTTNKKSILDYPAVDNNGIPLLTMSSVSKAPGAELLVQKELELCTKVPLLPMHYIATKDAIVRELYQAGELTLQGVRRRIKLDDNKTKILHDFFVTELQRVIGRDVSGGYGKSSSSSSSSSSSTSEETVVGLKRKLPEEVKAPDSST